MTEVQIQVGELAFEFETYTRWVNKARSWFANAGLTGSTSICIDSLGRVCCIGSHFIAAERDGAFPVRVYRLLNNPGSRKPRAGG